MRIATASRPVENFATNVVFPERLEGEEPTLGEEGDGITVDENGDPVQGDPQADPGFSPDEAVEPDAVDEAWVDRAMGRSNGSAEDDGAPEGDPPN
jgi:hypothetical protein